MFIKINFYININYKKILKSLDIIRNKSCLKALILLKYNNKLINKKLIQHISLKLKNLLKLKIIDKEILNKVYITSCFVKKYKFLKRTKIRARGKIYSIQKKSSIVTLFLTNSILFNKINNVTINNKNKNIFIIK
jgi:ribosomal protein L22